MQTKVHKAISYALIDLGIEVVTHVPGYGGSETFLSYNELNMKKLSLSFHEEPAYSIAHSASVCGKRSTVLMKAHGLAKAANAAIDSLYTNTNAGFVTLIFDDKDGSHSDNIMETEPFIKGISFPYHIAEKENIYNDVIFAFYESEKLKLPLALIVDSNFINDDVNIERRTDLKKQFSYKRDVVNHVVHPMFAEYQYSVFKSKRDGKDFRLVTRPNLITVPEQLPERTKGAALKYQPIFDYMKNLKIDFAAGDTSSSSAYCLPPYNAIDLVTHIGGSISLAVGAFLSGFKNVWALTGDFGFISAGHLGLLEAIQRETPIKVVIFYNKQASATGGQTIHKNIMRRLLAGYQNYLIHLSNPSDPFEVSEKLDELNQSDTLKILLADY